MWPNVITGENHVVGYYIWFPVTSIIHTEKIILITTIIIIHKKIQWKSTEMKKTIGSLVILAIHFNITTFSNVFMSLQCIAAQYCKSPIVR